MAAGMALATSHLGLDGHLLAHGQSGHTFTKCNNLTRYFMALGQGVRDIGVLAMEDMDIAATDSDPFHRHQDLSD